MSDAGFWMVVLLIGLGSFAFRIGFHAISGRIAPAPRLRRALESLPPAILTALLAPMVFRAGADGGLSVDAPTAVGVAVSLALGVATRNFLWALLGGLSAAAAMLIALGPAI